MSKLTTKKPTFAALIFVFTPGICSNAWSCEPIVPLGQLLGASSAAGPVLMLQSLSWLLAAVAIKSGAFALFDRQLSWRRAVLYMLFANVVSTIPGLLVAAFAASSGAVLLTLPLIFALGWLVERRVSVLARPGPQGWISGGTATFAFVVFFMVSVGAFAVADSALAEHSFATFWLAKFSFVTLAAGTGMAISTVLEECVIAQLAHKSHGNVSFYTSVLRANYLTLAAVLLVAALVMLPRRLVAPHFIVSWLHTLSALLGPA